MMMNTQIKKLCLVLIGLSLIGTSYAARTTGNVNTTQYGTTPQSSVISPITPTPRTKCPQLTVYQTTLNSTSQLVTLASINTNRQNPDPYGGFMLYVLGSGGGTLSANCSDANYPYLCGFHEEWIMVGGSGGPRLYYRCCAPPQPSMKMVYDSSSWVNGTDCN